MKRLLLPLFFVLIAFSASAQKIHFTDTSNKWAQFFDIYNDGNPPIYAYDNYRFLGDTVMAGHTYRRFSFDSYFSEHASGAGSYVREDTILKKLYIRDMRNDSDIVLMYYNPNVGDTFTTVYDTVYHCYYKYNVAHIDSAVINGVWHRTWYMPIYSPCAGSTWPVYVIEGVGCIQHPTYMIWPRHAVEPPDPKVYCFSNAGITPSISPMVLHLDNTSSCTTFSHLAADDISILPERIDVYPNPAKDLLTIKSSYSLGEITISDVYGRAVYHENHTAGRAEIHLGYLSKGVYLLKVANSVSKLIKQ